jgi:hypothetical protein
VIPGASESGYGIGSLSPNTVYAVAGNGTEFAYNAGNGYNDGTIVGHPGATSGEGGSPSAVATNNSVIANSVSFDPQGNILIAGSGLQANSTEASVVQVVAKTTGTFYGVSMTAGNLYTVADVAAGGAPATAINMGAVIVGGYGVTTDASGDVFVGAAYGVDMLNFGVSPVSNYGKSEPVHSSTTIAGNAAGLGVCTNGASTVGATSGSGIFYNNTAPTVDPAGNLYLTDNEGGPSYGCVWAVPAQSGTLLGQPVTAGNAYKVAGNGGTSASGDGTIAVNANVGTTTAIALDQVGNIVLAEEGGAGTGVSPAVRVVATSSGSYYGQSMVSGDIYTISGGASASGTTVPGNAAGFQLRGVSSLDSDGQGDLVLTDQGSNGTDPTSGKVFEINGGPTPSAPVITTQPLSQAAFAGQSVTFTAAATGSPTPSKQWYEEAAGANTFTAIPGATSDSYTIPSVTEAMSGAQFGVQYTNTLGVTPSSPATLSVYTLSWKTPAPITYGTALSATQLGAKVTFATKAVTGGVITYNPPMGTVLDAGSQTLGLSFQVNGAGPVATASVPLTVNPAKVTLTWAQPAAVPFGTALSSTQLDATATFNGNPVPGTFTYVPAAGTIPKVGTAALKVSFTPSSSNFLAALGASKVVVNALPDTTSLSISPSTVAYGSEQLAVITVQVSPGVSTPYPTVGKVVVSSGATPLCSITLASVGSCVVTSNTLLSAGGPYSITGTFTSSNKEFATSTSPAASLTVTP